MLTKSQWCDILDDARKARLKFGYQLEFIANDNKKYHIHSVQDDHLLLGVDGVVSIFYSYFNKYGSTYNEVRKRFVVTKDLTLDELIN